MCIDEKLAEAVRGFPILYNKSLKDFKDRVKKELAWTDVATSVGFASGKSSNCLPGSPAAKDISL